MSNRSPRLARPRLVTLISAVALLLAVLALAACQVPDPFVASYGASSSSSTAAPWPSFTDRGSDGWTMSYPPTWKALDVNANRNDDIFMQAAAGTSIEITVATVTQSPAAVLAQNTPSAADQARQQIRVKQWTLAGHPAIDVFIPYTVVPTPVNRMPNSGSPGITGGRTIMMAATNDSGTTNIYTFMVRYDVDNAAIITPASQALEPEIMAMLSTFQLPSPIGPVAQR